MNNWKQNDPAICLIAGLVLVGAAILVGGISPTQAQGGDTSTPTGDNAYCLVCHSEEAQSYTLPDGTELSLAVDTAELAASVHGEENPEGAVGCVDCHGDAFPHEGPPPANMRVFRVERSEGCADCHTDQVEHLADGVHYTALLAGNLRAATCVDCHGGHDVQSLEDARERIPLICGTCHEPVFRQYEQSVHGQALFAGDPNVPTCVDCHGVHGIAHPTTPQFRNRSPELCASCHADAELMAEYDITTNVFNSYLTDFHGTTVALFEQQDPNVPTNKAVCYDCHGVHDIAAVDAENSHVIRENLLETCQQCHPDATADFPDAWIGHYPPTLETQPLLFIVNSFYSILIPGTIGIFMLLIVTDIIRRIRQRISKNHERGA